MGQGYPERRARAGGEGWVEEGEKWKAGKRRRDLIGEFAHVNGRTEKSYNGSSGNPGRQSCPTSKAS